MAGKTQTQQQLDELEKVVARLDTLMEVTRKAVEQVISKLSVAEKTWADAKTEIALLKGAVEELKQARKDTANRLWTIVPPIIGAIASVSLSAQMTYLLTRK